MGSFQGTRKVTTPHRGELHQSASHVGPDAETTETPTDAPIQSSHSNAELESDTPEPRRSTRVRRQVSKWWSGDASELAAVVPEHLPTYSRATKGEEAQAWKGSIDSELKSLAKNGTWALGPRQQTQNVLTPKWVFKRKDIIDADGIQSVKYKARLVCRGCQQVHGVDYHETYAPVVKFATLQMLLALVAHFDLELHQMDIVTAFLNGDLLVIVLVYVDDLLLASNNMSEIMKLKEQFNHRVEMKDLGEARICLGLEIRRNREAHTLHLGQAQYAAKFLERYGIHESRPVATPMECQLSAQDVNGDWFDATLYRQAIGSLMYLMVGTRPDIIYALGQLSQYVQCPTEALWNGVKRVLRYVNGTRELVILFDGTTDLWPVGFCDSDWAGDQVDRKSTSGYVFVVGSGAVSWKSKKQSVVAASSCEAEYISLAIAAQESVWLGRVFGFARSGTDKKATEVHVSSDVNALELNVDNQSCIKMARNDSSSTRNKHIDMKYHIVRDLLGKKLLRLSYCPTASMTADVLTKPLRRLLFERHREEMGVRSM